MMTWNNYNFSFPSSSNMINIYILNDFLLIILSCIMFLVLFNFKFMLELNYLNLNFSENHYLEFIWTLIPMFIFCFIIFSSVSTLYFSDSCFFCGSTILVMGHQWYWSYILKDFDNMFFDSYMISSILRLIEVDNRLVVPFFTPCRLIMSSADVIHSWTIPSLGVKMDCIPGRLNQICFTVSRSGIFFGQCSEICGVNHSFMPIVMESVKFENLDV